jgi:hypothetical protein
MSGLAICKNSQTPVFQEGCGLHPHMFEEMPKVIAIALVVLPALSAAITAWMVSASLIHTVYAAGITLGVMSTVSFAFMLSLKQD